MPIFIISPILIFVLGFIVGLAVGTNDKKSNSKKAEKSSEPHVEDSDPNAINVDRLRNALSIINKTEIELDDFKTTYKDKVYNVGVIYKKEKELTSYENGTTTHRVPVIKVTSKEWTKEAKLYCIKNSSINDYFGCVDFQAVVDDDFDKDVPDKVVKVCKIMLTRLCKNVQDKELERNISDFGRDGK